MPDSPRAGQKGVPGAGIMGFGTTQKAVFMVSLSNPMDSSIETKAMTRGYE